MARPKVFLSSTFYDLRQIRAELDIFISSLGYDTVRNEEGHIPYDKIDALEDYCYEEIKNVDIMISIIGSRFGTESISKEGSISQIELRTALKEKKLVYIFIDKNVFSEYETYLINKDNDISFKYVDDIRIYKFIEEIKSLANNNNIKAFETASDITRYLKEQFAGLFQKYLTEQNRIEEVSLIQRLEKTAQTLNKMVNYLTDENKENSEEINKILMTNHPLVDEIKILLKIPYNFYIEGYEDLKKLLSARSFIGSKDIAIDNKDYFNFINPNNNYRLLLSKSLFDSENKLIYKKRIDWDKKDVIYEELKSDKILDDLPF